MLMISGAPPADAMQWSVSPLTRAFVLWQRDLAPERVRAARIVGCAIPFVWTRRPPRSGVR
jgi:hypothetical protein